MKTIQGGSFDSPSETRTFASGKIDILSFEGASVAKATFEPGWRWSQSVKPVVGGDSCRQHHLGYAVSGRLKVVADDGTEMEAGPGDVYVVQPGHDAWVVGDEPFVGLEFQGRTVETYGKE